MSSKKTHIFILECLNMPGQIVLDKPEQNYSCGRGKDNHIVCLGLTVSRKHCIFVHSKEELYVSDLKSSNGIYINGIKQLPHNMVKLNEDDIIGIGCDFSTSHDKNMFAYKLRILKHPPKAKESNCSALSSTMPVSKALARSSLDNRNSCISKRINDENCDTIVPSKMRKLEDFKEQYFTGNHRQSSTKDATSYKTIDKEMQDIIIISDNILANTRDNTNFVDFRTNHSNDNDTGTSSSRGSIGKPVPPQNDTVSREAGSTVLSKLDDLLNEVNVSPILKCDRNLSQNTAISTFPISEMNPEVTATPVASRRTADQCVHQAHSFQSVANSTPKVHTIVAKDSSNLESNLVTNDGTVIKMEEELQITDNEESLLADCMADVSKTGVSPIKLKKVKQEPKTRFSVVDVVNLSDSEDDIFPCSQLFDTEVESQVDHKIEVKQEISEGAFHTSHDSDDIILLSDTDSEDNPWLERLSRSQVFNDDDDNDNSATNVTTPSVTSESLERKTSSSIGSEPIVSREEVCQPCTLNESKEQIAAPSVRISQIDAATSVEPSMPTNGATSKSTSITNISVDALLSNEIQRILVGEVTSTDSSNQASRHNNSFGSSSNGSAISESKISSSGRRPPQIIDPSHLFKGRRKSIGVSNEVTEASKKAQMTKRTSTKEKRELQEKRKLDQHRQKIDDRRRRLTHKWADCLLPGKAKGDTLSKEEKKMLAIDRKAKLKKLTEEKAMLAEDNQKVKRQVAKPKAKVSAKNRSDLLLDEFQNTSTTRMANDKNSAKSKVDNCPSSKQRKTSATENKAGSSVDETRFVKEVIFAENKDNPNSETDLNDVTRGLEESLNLNESRKSLERSNSLMDLNSSRGVEISPNPLPSAELNDEPVNTVTTWKSVEHTVQPSVHSELNTQNENCSPNRLGEKKNSVKKRVTFSSKLVEVREYEIDAHNTLNKLVGKDAPIPRDKLHKRPVNVNTPCPKIEEFLLRIFRWNPTWLEEQSVFKTMAPVVEDSELRPMLSHYISFGEYYNIALPLLLLETWCAITKEFETKGNGSARPTMMCSIVKNSIALSTVPSTHLQTNTLLLEVLVTKSDVNRKRHPNYGDLVFFEYSKNIDGKQTFQKVFAYITAVHQTILTPMTYFNKDLQNYIKDPYALLTYTIMTRVLDKDIATNRVQRLRSVTYLRASMRTVQALQYLPFSPLVNHILNPLTENYQLPSVNKAHFMIPLVTRDQLNLKQLEAVLKVTECVVRQEAKLCLIHGPPGTGKSKVIVNIVTQILYGDNRYKNNRTPLRILVCAPSNAAIDEIVVRLLAIRSTFSNNRFRMVRLGRPETMHPSAKHISVTELAKRDVKRTASNYSSDAVSDDNIEEEKLYLEAQINATRCEMSSSQNTDEIYRKHLKTKVADMTVKYELLQNRKSIGQMNPRDLQKLQRMAENRVLVGADIITCTLSSCYTNQMESLFGGSRERISVCIVDEATQSCEAETLIPLMLGVNTLVLVGDPNQLPATIISQQAKQLGLDQSLFSRIHRAFESKPNNPVIMLDVQYRMASAISYWPNKYFYGRKIKNATASSSMFPYHPYRVLNLDSNQNEDKFSNTNEAAFIATMIYAIITHTHRNVWKSHITIGVLTPYNNQRNLILPKIHEKICNLTDDLKKSVTVEVNTVDSFQGQERDIIIMSCVRSHGIGFLSDKQRLCVALTRAKHSLILCGNFTTFMRDSMWNALLSDAKWRHAFFDVPANAPVTEIKSLIAK